MRLPLILSLSAALAAPLAAQTGTLAHPPAPAARPQPQPRYPARDRYYDDRYVLAPPEISMDSAAFVVERKYEGWHVNSKQIGWVRHSPIYIFDIVAAGEISTRKVVVDGDTGEVLNPEVMGAPSDSTSYWREHRNVRYRTRTYP
jgi:hypothetical protein